jgi:hypothetical protein
VEEPADPQHFVANNRKQLKNPAMGKVYVEKTYTSNDSSKTLTTIPPVNPLQQIAVNHIVTQNPASETNTSRTTATKYLANASIQPQQGSRASTRAKKVPDRLIEALGRVGGKRGCSTTKRRMENGNESVVPMKKQKVAGLFPTYSGDFLGC